VNRIVGQDWGMQASDAGGRRRRRRPRQARGGEAGRGEAGRGEALPGSTASGATAPDGTGRPQPDEGRGLRNLVGAGPSQLGVSGALRGRDVNRPTEADLAEAERDVVIVRRHWKPPA
jgi:hypothetical protein